MHACSLPPSLPPSIHPSIHTPYICCADGAEYRRMSSCSYRMTHTLVCIFIAHSTFCYSTLQHVASHCTHNVETRPEQRQTQTFWLRIERRSNGLGRTQKNKATSQSKANDAASVSKPSTLNPKPYTPNPDPGEPQKKL